MGLPMMPSPMNPTFMSLLLSEVRLDPAEPVRGRGFGFVLAADPAVVANPLEELEQEWIVDLARTRLVAPGIVRELQVPNLGEVPLDRGGQVALHDLHVIDVVLQVQ